MSVRHPEVSIKNLATSVYDNGRRGSPRPGCDCVVCFGYCMIDADKAYRELRVCAEAADKVGGEDETR